MVRAPFRFDDVREATSAQRDLSRKQPRMPTLRRHERAIPDVPRHRVRHRAADGAAHGLVDGCVPHRCRAPCCLGSVASTTLIGLVVMSAIFGIGMAVFGVRIDGSVAGFAAIVLAFVILNASFGLLLAALGNDPDVTRGLAIFATLLLVMLGGAWVPSFVFPEWMQHATQFVPTRWAVDGLAAMTWRAWGLKPPFNRCCRCSVWPPQCSRWRCGGSGGTSRRRRAGRHCSNLQQELPNRPDLLHALEHRRVATCANSMPRTPGFRHMSSKVSRSSKSESAPRVSNTGSRPSSTRGKVHILQRALLETFRDAGVIAETPAAVLSLLDQRHRERAPGVVAHLAERAHPRAPPSRRTRNRQSAAPHRGTWRCCARGRPSG